MSPGVRHGVLALGVFTASLDLLSGVLCPDLANAAVFHLSKGADGTCFRQILLCSCSSLAVVILILLLTWEAKSS